MSTRSAKRIALALLLLAATGGAALAGDDANGVPPGRLTKLTRGIGLSDWFGQPEDDPDGHMDPANMAKDAALIKAMGFRHVRLPFSETDLTDANSPTTLNAGKMKRFDAALDMLQQADLAVIIDFSAGKLRARMATDDAAVDSFVALWRALAGHLASRDPEMIFLEVLNEPTMTDANRWNVIQTKALGLEYSPPPAQDK